MDSDMFDAQVIVSEATDSSIFLRYANSEKGPVLAITIMDPTGHASALINEATLQDLIKYLTQALKSAGQVDIS